MPTLADLQSLFQERLLTGAPEITAHLVGAGPFLKVYDHAYTMRLLEVMGEDFPAVHTLLGDDAFATAARAYLAEHPSTRRSIRWLGEKFADWLRTASPWHGRPVVADMAAFEWALGLAFDAPDAVPLPLDAFAAVPPEAWPELAFTIQPALSTFDLTFDVAPFQQAVANDRDPDSAPETFPVPQTWAAWRDAETLIVRYRALEGDEARGLSVVRAAGPFAALCEEVAKAGTPHDPALRAAELLRLWVDSGWIVGLDTAEG